MPSSMRIPLERFNGSFDLNHTLNSWQCTADLCRFENKPHTFFKLKSGWVKVTFSQPNNLRVKASRKLSKKDKKELKEEILYFFWSKYPLGKFYNEFAEDEYLSQTFEPLRGMRVMKSKNLSWSLMEAVYSQNTTVEQVRNRDRLFRKNYGKEVQFNNGTSFHTFPNLSKIAKLSEEELRENCKVGYRAPYILNAAKRFKESDLRKMKSWNSEKARNELMKVKGIGPKVADIFLLYGLGMRDVFPMDVWLKRALIREYFNGEKQSEKELRDFALDYFGNHAGFAHLYMFYWERKFRDK